MPMASNAIVETFKVYQLPNSDVPNDMGEMPSNDLSNMEEVGEVTGRVTTGDSLEPDVLGTNKNFGQDVTSMWIGFFDLPGASILKTGMWIISPTDSTRRFELQFVDQMPGGVVGHHVECRLQTTEIERDG